MRDLIENPEINTIIYCLKTYMICIFTYYMSIKIVNIKTEKMIKVIIILIPISIIGGLVNDEINHLLSILILTLLLSILYSKLNKNNIGYSVIIITISLSINYILYFLSIAISFLPNNIFNIKNDYVTLMAIAIIYAILNFFIRRIKKIKNGFNFLKKNIENDYMDILILNISVIILFCIIIISNYTDIVTSSIGIALIIFSIIMFITIQKSLELYYKQKLQKRELEETREELKKVKEERNELQKENLKISKEKHPIVYNQEKLEYKINQLLLKNETAEELQIKDKIEEISNKIRNEDATIELTKTGIEEIDDMLKYMQAKCKKNNINFELQVKGNIHHMINKFIEKKDLEILLADHIKNAIIAINYSKNINKSILVKLGIIDGVYSVYFYDTGTEFNKETLLNLGKKPSTTHADNGGTGMGFLNTFDKLKKYKASITINEYGKPCEDNYTKYIAIKFDNKNEYQIHSYRFAEMKSKICRNGDVSKWDKCRRKKRPGWDIK